MDKLFQRSADVLTRKVAGETLLIPVRGNLADMQRIFALNELGEFIFGRLDGKTTLGRIAEDVVSAFTVAAAEAERDVRAFVSELRKADLVSEVR